MTEKYYIRNDKHNALLAEICSTYRYEAHKTEGYRKAGLLHITPCGKAINERGWAVNQVRTYSLDTTAEIHHTMDIVGDLIEKISGRRYLMKEGEITLISPHRRVSNNKK